MVKGAKSASSEARQDWRLEAAKGQITYSDNLQVQRRLENALEGQPGGVKNMVMKLSENNKAILAAFLTDFITTENPKPKTIKMYIASVFYLSRYMNQHYAKDNFRDLINEELMGYLQSYRNSLESDPNQKWISTHNLFATTIIKFLKWLYFPTVSAKDRKKPEVAANIRLYRKKNLTNVKPEDLWTVDEDSVFLRYCPDPRIALYHTHSIDTSGRPHELLSKRISDFRLKNFEGKIYGEQEIGRTGKTKGRVVPLISCIPYFKALLAMHPEGTNPNAFVYRSFGVQHKYKNKPIDEKTLYNIYTRSMKNYFTHLLERADVPPEDKAIIQAMLQKPWYPYLRRHMSLTEKARLVNEYQLRLHAGWSKDSQMIKIYTHELGGESSRAFLEAYGVLPKDSMKTDGIIMPKECPECRELNKPDALYCVKCNFAISIKAAIQKEETIEALKADLQKTKQEMQDEIEMSRKWRKGHITPTDAEEQASKA